MQAGPQTAIDAARHNPPVTAMDRSVRKMPMVAPSGGGRLDVPHFTNKARVDAEIAAAGFRYYSYVMPAFTDRVSGVGEKKPEVRKCVG